MNNLLMQRFEHSMGYASELSSQLLCHRMCHSSHSTSIFFQRRVYIHLCYFNHAIALKILRLLSVELETLPFGTIHKSYNAVFIASTIVVKMYAIFKEFNSWKSSNIIMVGNTGISAKKDCMLCECFKVNSRNYY